MDKNRQNAYRWLLYRAMLQIRPLRAFRLRWWNPIGMYRDLRAVRLCGSLAHQLHNLARDSSHDPFIVNEEIFWDFFEKLDSDSAQWYRQVFERRLEELNSRN